MNCQTCGYKLTVLFTSTACDKCDGLLAEDQACGAGPLPSWVPFQNWLDLKPGQLAKFQLPAMHKPIFGQVLAATLDYAQMYWNDNGATLEYFANEGQVELFRAGLQLITPAQAP